MKQLERSALIVAAAQYFFLATSVAMMIENGCPRGGLTGFFYAEVW